MGPTGEDSPFYTVLSDPGETCSKDTGEQVNGFRMRCCIESENLSVRQRNVMRRELDAESDSKPSCSEGFSKKRNPLHAKCTSSTRSHNSRNLFSLGNGLILILLIILYWTCFVHGGFPGRGPPPPPRGPPLLAHHPLAPGGAHSHTHSRNSPFGRRRPPPPHPLHGHRHGPPPKPGKKSSPPNDLAVAAQTLYDLRGYHVPFPGPEAPRYHRQNDPFTLPTPLSQNPRERGVHHLPQDSRTAPLVFPSFYQEQPTPTPTRATIFGHNQHLSQTRFEPPGSFHLGGNSASGKITLEQQSSSSRDQFRPSQIDISLHNNQVPSTPLPYVPKVPSSLVPEKKSVGGSSRTRTPVKLSKNQQQDPFVYVYDEVDYDEGDESDFTLDRQRTPQNQINNNRITPSTSTTTTAPLRSREPTIVPTQNPYNPHPQYLHQSHQALYSTSTTTKQPTTTQNNIYYNPQKDDFRDPFGEQEIRRPPVTPRPNVEIVPSSERKPPPDQSNAIVPALSRLRNEGRDYHRGAPSPPQTQHQIPLINDNFRRQPVQQSTTTTSTPPSVLLPQYQRESIYNIQPQGRQVSPNPPQTPVPYFPAGLDRRPFETQNEIQTPVRNGQTQHHFDQVVNLLQEEEEQYPSQNNNNPGENLVNQYNIPSKLRPVNTIIPKNRIPKEDIILPPNFPFTHAIDNTTPLTPLFKHHEVPQRVRGDPTQQRVREQNQVTRIREEIPRIREQNQVTRIREEIPRVRDEVTRAPVVPQRVVPTQSQVRSRPSVIFPDEYEDDNQNFISQPQGIEEPAQPPSQPTRSRGRQPQAPARTTTSTAAPVEQSPQRTRAPPTRQRLRPNYNRPTTAPTTTTTSTTTTTTTTTTPVPTYVEYPSQEYVEDYNDTPQQRYQQSPPPPPQVQAPEIPVQKPKPISRFPPFPNKNQDAQQELVTTPQSPPLQRQRPQVASQERPQGRQRPEPRQKGSNRFRETTTPDSPTSPRTTGKPLYTTGKMLSKEGGLYAGQRITSSHVYGQPIPNIPINSVFDKVPGVLDGKSVVLATTKPSFGSPQKHLRSKQRPQPEHGPPKRIRPAPKAQQENSLDIVETVTLKPTEEQPKRLRAGNQFIRGQSGSVENNESKDSQQEVLPRRRKVRPGPRRQQQQQNSGSPDSYTETVSIHPPRGGTREIDDDDAPSVQTERTHIGREPSVETTTSSLSSSPRSRRPRPPRPGGKPNFSSQQHENVSERSRESAASEDSEDKPQKPVKKLRPRLRPVPQLNPQQQRGQPSEVITQSQSAQVDRKPTDAPGRFSSRFRDEDPETSTAISSNPGRFSPPTGRPTFKPPPPQKKNLPRNKRPQQQQQGDRNSGGDNSDELPDSIKLSPKDVIANRKPARRIPPGSASDRLKALQQRRNKVFGKPNEHEEEETAEGRQIPVTKRPRLKAFTPGAPKVPAVAEDEDDQPLPQPQKLRRPTPQRHQSQEASGSKREILQRPSQQNQLHKNQRGEIDYYNNREVENKDDFVEEDNSEYTNDEQGSSSPNPISATTFGTVQTERNVVTVTSRPVGRPNGGGFHRNKSVEVTSDEARSVLGIPRPAAPNRITMPKKLLPQQHQRQIKAPQQPDESEEEDEQEEEEAERQQFRQRPRFSSNKPQLLANKEGEREINTIQSEYQQTRLPRPGAGPGGRLHQQRIKQNSRQQPQDEEENDQSEYKEEDGDEDKAEPPRKSYLQQQNNPYLSSSTFSPSPQILRKKLNTNQNRNTAEVNDENEDDASPPSSERTTVTSTSTSSTSTSTSSSTSPFPSQGTTAERLPVALPVRAGPQPIKQGLLKARLRPNKRLNGVGGDNGAPQPRVSITASTTQATITTTESRKVGRGSRGESVENGGRGRGEEEGLKHSTTQLSKSPRPRLGGGRSGKRKEKKFIAMATENPSLPLESIFPEV